MRGKTKTNWFVVMIMTLFIMSIGLTAKAGSGDKHTVTLQGNGGTFYNQNNSVYEEARTIEVNDGDAVGYVAEPYSNNNNVLFDGWYGNQYCEGEAINLTTYVPTEDTILYAKWRDVDPENDAYITVNFNGGSFVGNIFIHEGDTSGKWYMNSGKLFESVGAPYLYRNNHAFTGWYSDAACKNAIGLGTAINAGDTIYAGWTREYYTVTLDAGEGYFESDESNKTYSTSFSIGSSVYLTGYLEGQNSNYTKDGKVITAWYTDKDLTNEVVLVNGAYTPTDDVTLYAKWESGFKVTFDYGIAAEAYSGNEYKHSYYVKKNVKLPYWADNMTGKTYGEYVFDGWYLDKECENRYVSDFYNYIVVEDVTFYAKWSKKVTVIYDAGNGKFYDGTSKLTTNIPLGEYLRIGYTAYSNDSSKAFLGWSLTNGGQIIDDNLIVPDKTTTLYAVYGDGCKVTFHGNEGTIVNYCEYWETSRWYTRMVNKDTLTLTYPKNDTISNYDFFDNGTIYTNGPNNKTLLGWSKTTSSADIIDLKTYKLESGTLDLYAIWADSCKVTFDANGGYFYTNKSNTLDSRTYASGIKIPYTPGFPSYDGDKAFRNWNTKKDGSGTTIEHFDIFDYVITGDVTFYAQWDDAWTVSFDANGGKFVNYGTYVENLYVVKVAKGKSVDPVYSSNIRNNDSSKAFVGWSSSANSTEIVVEKDKIFKPTQNTTLYAVWKNGNKVTYHANATGGYYTYNGVSVTEFDVTVPEGTSIGNVYYPTPSFVNNDENKMFVGYNTKADGSGQAADFGYVPTGDVELFAQWKDSCKVYYHANGGSYSGWYAQSSGSTEYYVTQVEKGSNLYIFKSYKPDHTGSVAFLGWSDSPNGTNIIDQIGKVTKDTHLYAVWEDGFTITLDGNGGKINPHEYEEDLPLEPTYNIIIPRGDTVYPTLAEHPCARKDGYILYGWSTTKNDSGKISISKYKPPKDMTLYALWKKAYTVKFYANGGKFYGSQTEVTSTFAEGTNLYFLSASNSDKGVVRWNTMADGSGVDVTEETVVNSDMSIYAIWGNGYTVTLNAGEGYLADEERMQSYTTVVAEGKSIDIPIGAGIDFGVFHDYKFFEGWYEDANFQKKVCDYTYSDPYYSYTPDHDITLYAKFEEGYTVTFNGNNGWVYNNDSKIYSSLVRKGSAVGKEIYAYAVEGNAQSSQGFTGWYKEPECKNLVATRASIANYVPNGNVTLYAGFLSGEVKVSGVSLSKSKASLGIYDTLDLTAIVMPSNATNPEVVFESANPAIATVDESGTVKAKGIGETTIKVTTTDGNFSAECTIKVDAKNSGEIAETINTTKNTLEQQKNNPDKTVIKNTVETCLQNLGTKESIADKVESNQDIAEKLTELEEAYTDAAGIDVIQPKDDGKTKDALKEIFGDNVNTDVASVSGAGLNVAPGKVARLGIEPIDEDNQKEVSEEYNCVGQMDIELKEGDNANTATTTVQNSQIIAPITITLPLPKNIQLSKLFVLHYYSDGSYELIKPVFSNNSMTITVYRFSVFAIVELADGQAINNGGGNNGGNEGNGGDGNNVNGGNEGNGGDGNNVNGGNEGNGGDGNNVNGGNEGNGGNGNDGNAGNNPGNDANDNGAIANTGNGDANNGNGTNNGENVVPGNGENTGDGNNSGDGNTNNANETQEASVPVGTKVSTKNGNYVVTKEFEVTFKSPIDKKVKKGKVDSIVTISGKKHKVTAIDNNAFKNCKKMVSVSIPKSVVTIGKNAFSGCKELKSVTIASGVNKIGSNAFSGCSKLSKITIKSTKLKSIGKNAFKGIKKGAVIKVPKSKKKAYAKLFKKAKLPDSVKIK